jgi:methylglutaconyl-CoA hydratase
METIKTELRGAVYRVTIDRPEVKNAFNEVVIRELREVFGAIPTEARVVVLTGGGSVFCAGADVNWMKKSKSYTEEQNRADASAMSAMFRAIDECPTPVIGRINGVALGGGTGLTAVCDIAVAVEGAQFGFTEVRLGIVPAVISAYVLPKIGPSMARRYFITGERFGVDVAMRLGLVHEVAKPEELDVKVEKMAAEVLMAGPQATGIAKKLVHDEMSMTRDQAVEYTARTISKVRVGPEAQEGLGAFLEKRKPNWMA